MSSGIRVPNLVMVTGVNQIPAPGQPGNLNGLLAGWITGTIANLAANSSADIWFDLGSDWHQYSYITMTIYSVGPSTGINPLQVFGADTYGESVSYPKRLGFAYSTGGSTTYQSITTGGSPTQYMLKPLGRFIHATATNVDVANAQGSTSGISLGAFTA